MSSKGTEKIKKNSASKAVAIRIFKNPMAIVGILLVIILCFAAVFAPILTQYSPTKVTVSDAFLTPSLKHFAGTDDLGRDIFTRLLYGSRYSILLGVASTAGALIIGIFIGSISGYFGGQVDNIIMRILDVIQSMPSMLFAIIISAVLGAGFVQTIVALSIAHTGNGKNDESKYIVCKRYGIYRSSKINKVFKCKNNYETCNTKCFISNDCNNS